jgi:hypothetical protein
MNSPRNLFMKSNRPSGPNDIVVFCKDNCKIELLITRFVSKGCEF